MKTRFFILILLFVAAKIFAQCNFIPLLNNDFNLPGYSKATSSSVVKDTAGRYFVASIDLDNFSCPVVHMYNGTTWKKLGSIFNTGGCQNVKIAVDAAGTPYVAFRDGNNGSKLTVLKYTAGIWSYVGGSPGISVGAVWSLDIKVDSNGFPIVAYEEQSSQASVKKFDGTSWNYIGTQYISPAYATYVSLALNSADVPYVAYSDGIGWPSLNATVKRFDGANWVLVGPQQFSASQADYIDLEFDKNNNLFIAYSDHFYSAAITVKKFNSTNWVNVGPAGFTGSQSKFITLDFDTLGVPYIAFQLYTPSASSLFKANVVKYNGSLWVNVGPSSGVISEKNADYTSILIDENNLPLVAYIDENRHSKVAVKKFNNTTWDFIGDKGFSVGVTKNKSHSIAVDKNGVTYACFSDSLNGYKGSVMKYFNGAWSYVGLPGFTAGTVDHMCLKFDTLNTPFISFTDGAYALKQSVMKFNGTAWNYVGSPGFSPFQSGGNYLTFYNNTPYIVSTGTVTNYLNIYTHNGSAWVTYPSVSYIGGGNFDVKIQFDTTGAMYLLSRNSSNMDVGKFNGISWQNLTFPGLGSGSNIDFCVEKGGTPYVIYTDINSPYKTFVKKYTTNGWVLAGSGPVSLAMGVQNSIIDVNGIKYIAYTDKGYQNKINLLKFNGINWSAALADSSVSAGAAYFSKLTTDNAGNIYLLHKSTESYAKKINFINTLSIASTPAACSGQTMVLTASGASSYTWNTTATTSSIVITPTATTNYYVNSVDANNCIVTAIKTVTVLPLPVVNVSGAGNLCIGNSTTLTATGANTYTWLPSTISNSMVVSPTVSTVYTVVATSTIGCQNTKTVSPVILQLPLVNAAISNTAICQNTSFTLTGSGAIFYYLNSNSLIGNTSIQFPNSTSTYTLLGVDGFNCANTHTFTVLVSPLPSLTISPSSSIICAGQSVTLQASGAATYTWNSVPGGSVYIDTPTSNTNYFLQGTNPFGCSNSTSLFITVSVCTSLESNSDKTEFILYPNPSSGIYDVKSSVEFNKIIIFNAIGQIIKVLYPDGNKQIDMTSEPGGIYIAKLFYSTGAEKTIRLIKQ